MTTKLTVDTGNEAVGREQRDRVQRVRNREDQGEVCGCHPKPTGMMDKVQVKRAPKEEPDAIMRHGYRLMRYW